jgi:hypothetical protein
MRWFYAFFFLLPVSLSGCDRDAVVAQVGQFTITRQDVAWRDAIHRLYFPWDERILGLEELVHAYTAAQILVNNGYAITPEVIEAEERRIQQTTLMPERLTRIQRVFQGNQDGYRRVYVLPTLVERVIYYEFFLHDPKAQAESLGRAETVLAKAQQDPPGLLGLAKEARLGFSRLTISLVDGIQWHHPDPNQKGKGRPPAVAIPAAVMERLQRNEITQAREDAQRWLKEVIAPLKAGEVYGKVIDSGEEWLVVRLLGPRSGAKDCYELECIAVPKDPYEPWLESQSKSVRIVK